MNNQGKSYDNIAEGFAKMRDSFNTEQKYLDALINYITEKSHILDIGCGSGFPIANYFTRKNFSVTGINTIRIYNPLKQSLDHDRDGKFILRYVPELQNIPQIFIHEPWRFDGFSKYYPKPIVDHENALEYAKKKISEYRQSPGFKETAKATHEKLGSRQSPMKKSQSSEKNKKQMSFNF